jgi:hypothetical protein
MNNFIKLTSMVINKSHITKITEYPSKYYITMTTSNKVHGFMLFSTGSLSSSDDMIEICKTKNKKDYNRFY